MAETAPSYTFSGGVIGEGLYGRVDLNKYQTGLKHAHNMVIAVEGGADKRFGTYLVGKPKYQDKNAKLFPWRIANDDSYQLEFGHNYIRFIRFGGYVSIPGGHVALPGNIAANVGGVMEVATPYIETQVSQLKFTYANDIMYIFHPSHAPRMLRRLGLYDWELITLNFNPHPAGPAGLALQWQYGEAAAGAFSWVDNMGRADPWATVDVNYKPTPETYSYIVSATLADGTETLPSAIISMEADLRNKVYRMKITWNAVVGAVQYTIYKGKNGVYGFVGYVPSTSPREYFDTNFAPSYDVVPLKDPWTFPAGEYPRVGEFYKQRFVYAAPPSEPQMLTISRPLVFNSLYKSVPSQADDAIQTQLVGRERHTINHMLQLKKFIIFTDTAEWVLKTANNDALTSSSIDPEPETAYGSDPWLRPIAIGDRILFVQNITGDIRDLGYEFTSDSYRADDLSRLARHMFVDRKIIAWTYGAFPQNLLHCVTADGALRSMTYVREHEIWGWATASTKGKFLDVSAVAEIGHDGVYFQIERTIAGVKTKFIERTEVNFSQRIEDMVYVDCALTYKDQRDGSALLRNSDIEVQFSVTSAAGLTVGNEIQLEIIEPSTERKEKLVGLYRAEITSIVGTTIKASPLRDPVFPVTFPDGTLSVLLCKDVITGLSHLNGEQVWVLADGKVVKDIAPAAGFITLAFKAARVHVGLDYPSYIETLDLDADKMEGRYALRAVDDIVLRLRNSRGVWAGPTSSPRELQNIPSRDQEGYYDAPNPLDGPYSLPSHVAWELTCGVRVESRDPLPLNILNVVPKLVYGN